MNFDIKGAMDAGYSEQDVINFLAQKKGFDALAARNAGYSDAEILQHLQPHNISWSDVPAMAAENFLPSAKRVASDLYDAVTSPIETATALGKTAAGYIPGVNSLVPESEEHAKAFTQYLTDRYGSMEGIKKAIATDPVGLLSDLSAFATGGAGALRGLAKGASMAGKSGTASNIARAADMAGQVAKYADPITAPLAAADAMGAGKALSYITPTPERLYQSALKPSTTLDPAERARVLQTGIQERILPTEAGLQKMQEVQSGLGQDINRLIEQRTQLENTGAVPRTIDPEQMVRSAMDYSHERLAGSPQANRSIASADNVLNDFVESHGISNIDTATAQTMKQRAQLEAQKAFGEPLVTPSQEAKKGIAHALRVGIEKNVPEVAPINKRLSNLNTLQPELERALGRSQNWDIMGLSAGLGGGGGLGYALGGPAGAVGGAVIGNILRQPGAKARIAFALDDMQKLKNSVPAQLAQQVFGGAISRPMRAGGYMGQRTEETFQQALQRLGIQTSLQQ